MKPFLTHSSPSLMETLPECCMPISRMLTSQEQLANHPKMRDDFADQVGTDMLKLKPNKL